MQNENLMLLQRLTKPVTGTEYRDEPTLAFSARDMYGQIETVHDVWHSPTGFGSKDDAVSIGYIRLPSCVRLNERTCRNYKLTSLSTSLTKGFLDDFKKTIEVAQVSKHHQACLFAHLFIV